VPTFPENAPAEIIVVDSVTATDIAQLAEVLVDCVAGGASVSFMPPFEHEDGKAFFTKVAGEVASGEAALLVARIGGQIVGTVQLGLALPLNQPHRADIKKLLVHRSARGRGIGMALMTSAEEAARARGRTLLVLDTALNGDAERLYTRAGWNRVGVIPDYALFPDGSPCDTVVFWKKL
jgi:ribosomal protein S18 acetylase RimI-like enzyme